MTRPEHDDRGVRIVEAPRDVHCTATKGDSLFTLRPVKLDSKPRHHLLSRARKPGRELKMDETRAATNFPRHVAAILLTEPELETN